MVAAASRAASGLTPAAWWAAPHATALWRMRSGVRGSVMNSSLLGTLPPATSTVSAARGRSQPTPTAPGPYRAHCSSWGTVWLRVSSVNVVACGGEFERHEAGLQIPSFPGQTAAGAVVQKGGD